jgi:hypothetical protein
MRFLFYLIKRQFVLPLSIFSILLLFFPICIQAAEVTLQWDEPNDSRIVGFNIYCGKSGSDYKSNLCATVNSPNTYTSKVSNLERGFEYSFTATSFDNNGNESDYSNTASTFIKPLNEIDKDGDGYSVVDGDCNDNFASISPGATEICDDGIDQDCDGSDLSCGNSSGTKTLIFGNIPGSDYPGTIQDTFININDDVNVNSDQLNTYTWPENSPANVVLIKFDLSLLPKAAKIESAILTLYQTAAGGDASYDVAVHKIINHDPDLQHTTGNTFNGVDNWTANNNCYNNIPMAQADIAPAEDVNSLDQNLGSKTWDITNMVQDWVSDSASNFGLLLNSDEKAGLDSFRFFAASEAADAGMRPGLEIKYTFESNAIDNDGDGYTISDGDCNDNDASIAPNANDTCGDGIDQNCDGSDTVCPGDIDDDNDGFTENQGDCNDNDASIAPNANDICGDGIDQNCDGSDAVCPGDIDDDNDGFTENQGDCNDNDASIAPNALEICEDGIDQDCDGSDLACNSNNGEESQTFIFGDVTGTDYPGTVQDTFININQDVNDTNNQLNTYTWPQNSPANVVLIKFDLSQIPNGAQIQSASLTLYQTEAGGDATYDVSVHKVINHNPDLYHTNGYTFNGTDNWTANNSCYNNIPLAQADIAPAEDVNSLDNGVGFKTWNITTMVKDWINDSASNFGLVLNSDATANADSYRFFAASEASNADIRPSLEVKYTFDPNEIDDDGDGFTEQQGDCNDNDVSIAPGAAEICGDGIDQDCDGMDRACTVESHTMVFGNFSDADVPFTAKDTFININQDVNETEDQLNTYTWPDNTPANTILMKFDLSQIPNDAKVQSAILTLYQTAAGGDTTYDVSVHKIINHNPDLTRANGYSFDGVNDWTANSVCYNSIPLAQVDIAPAEDVNTLDENLGYKSWNVTKMVMDWVTNSTSNFGLMLNSDTTAKADSYRFFGASEANDATLRPSLEVTYTVEF